MPATVRQLALHGMTSLSSSDSATLPASACVASASRMYSLGAWACGPIALGVAAGLGIGLVESWQPAAAAASLGCCVWGLLAHRRHTRKIEHAQAQYIEQHQHMQALGRELLPRQQQHLMVAHKQTETALTALATRLDGIRFAKAAKALPAYHFTPVVMRTTESQREKKVQAAGAKAWMLKPFHRSQLLHVVQRLVLP